MKQKDILGELSIQEKRYLYTKILQTAGLCLGRTGSPTIEFILGDIISLMTTELHSLYREEKESQSRRERKEEIKNTAP